LGEPGTENRAQDQRNWPEKRCAKHKEVFENGAGSRKEKLTATSMSLEKVNLPTEREKEGRPVEKEKKERTGGRKNYALLESVERGVLHSQRSLVTQKRLNCRRTSSSFYDLRKRNR